MHVEGMRHKAQIVNKECNATIPDVALIRRIQVPEKLSGLRIRRTLDIAQERRRAKG
jgi:hypothetical protein